VNLAEIYQKINTCNKCGLHKNRMVDYNYRGNPKASIMLIGEALGKTEQEEGFPFVGRCGKLLDELLLKVGLNPAEDVYITNLVKCRPIDNGKDRKPFYDEVVPCFPFLCEEMQVVSPKLLVTLGKTSGDWYNQYQSYEINKYYRDMKWLALRHPSYLLRKKTEIEPFIRALSETIAKINS
jgi:uracil-DNA glycosylase family 4